MPERKITIPIKWSIQISPNDLKDYLKAEERLKPAVFIIPAQHSLYMEFGTGPALNNSGEHDLYNAIYDWLKRKKGLSGHELVREAKRVSGIIARNGLRPRPFFRPAYYAVVDNLQYLFDQGYSLKEILEHMAQMTNDNIMWNVYAPKGSEYMPDTGMLQAGWIIRYLEDWEVEEAKREAIDVNEIADRVWPGPRKK